jgi:hypothetical protein
MALKAHEGFQLIGCNPRKPNNGDGAAAHSPERTAREIENTAHRLNRLLDATPSDLAKVAAEIRTRPDLEVLIMRIALSLQLAPEESVYTLDRALVVLGVQRVRVLIYMWSMLSHHLNALHFARELERRPSSANGGQKSSRNDSSGWTPEMMYLASFLRWLGLNVPSSRRGADPPPCSSLNLSKEEFADLREMMMRDFLALIPKFDPSILKTPQSIARER